MSAAGGTEPTGPAGPLPSPADLDALLGVLARHARELAAWGPVRLAAGPVELTLGEGTTSPAPIPVAGAPSPGPHLTAVPSHPVVPPPDPAPAAGDADAQPGPVVCSPTVGVFYRAAEPGAAPFVAEGDEVTVGQQVGIVEAMKLMIPLESDRAGRVVAVLVEDGQAVEHGQPVLRLAAT